MGDEEQYYDIWSGANLVDTLFLLVTIIMMFVFFFIRMVVPLTVNEIIIWVFIAETYTLGFILMRVRLREKHRKAVRNVKFCYAGVWRDFVYYEKMLLGVKQWYEIDIEWTDQMLDELFEDSYFKQLKEEIENWQKMDNFQRPSAIPKAFYNGNIDESDEDKTNELIDVLPFSSFDIKQITDDVKEKLKKLKIHIGILYEPTKYKDTELTFDRICLLTDTDIEKSLKTKPSFAVHQGYPVEIDQVECAFDQLGWMLPEIPVYYLAWSENITKKILEPALDSLSIVYIEMKVLEKFIYNLRAFSQQAAMALKQEKTKSDMFYDAWDDIIQELELINIREILGSKDLEKIKLEEQAKKAGQYKYLSYALGGFLVILLIFIIMILISTGSRNTVQEIPETSSLITNLFRYVTLSI